MRNSKLISVGNAIVDIISKADDDFLISMGYKKGSMNLVSEKNQNRILNSLNIPK